MAKSFYSILKEGTLEVNHKGNDVVFDLPSWLAKATSHLESEEDLLAWAQEYEVLHGLMHYGIQKLIIDLRAAARPQVKIFRDVDKAKAFLATIEEPANWHINTSQDEFSLNMVVDKKNAQNRINDFELKMVPKPGDSKKANKAKVEQDVLVKTINAMRTAGQEDSVIIATLEPAFGKEKVQTILSS